MTDPKDLPESAVDTRRSFVQKGAASLNLSFTGPPRDFHFLLLPKLTMLAFSAAVEPLRIANQVTKHTLYRWYTMTPDGAPVTCSNGVPIMPDGAMHTLDRNDTVFVCSGVEPAYAASEQVLAWLRRQKSVGVTLGGICTGSFALAQAGLLSDQPFTLHWENQPAFREVFATLEPSGNLYEVGQNLLTCGGGSAATDMMLDIIERDHGRDLAIIVADMCIHMRSSNRKAPQKSALSVAIGSRNQRLLNAMQMMGETLEEPLSVNDIAKRLGISRRQLERLFKRYAGVSPSRFYYDLRISRAHALLNETNMSVTEIAMATGFSSTAHLASQFRRKFGVAPQGFRKGWQSGA